MILPGNTGFRIYMATKPVDFRKGMDGLAGVVQQVLRLDPYCGAAFVFRAKRGDRLKIDMPGVQEDLLKAVCAVGKPVVLVMLNGSAVAINWASENVEAIVDAWYPGEEGGTAIADVLFGDYNPRADCQ